MFKSDVTGERMLISKVVLSLLDNVNETTSRRYDQQNIHVKMYIPDSVVVDASPKVEFDFGTFVHNERFADGKVDREPGEHPVRVRLWHDRKTVALVKH